MRKKLALALLLSLCLTGAACGGRTPSNVKTAKIAKGFFNKYGKKFKDTQFGQSKVSQVEVKEVRELQKNVSTSFLLVKMADGTEIPVIMTLIRKPVSGWHTTSWEVAQE